MAVEAHDSMITEITDVETQMDTTGRVTESDRGVMIMA